MYYGLSFSSQARLLTGRKSDVDLKVSDDISVSRHHAIFGFDKGLNKFYVEDSSSKFGTLILINRPLIVHCKRSGLCVQASGNAMYMYPIVTSPNAGYRPAPDLFMEGLIGGEEEFD